MKEGSTKGGDPTSRLPRVPVPSRRLASPRLLHSNPLERVSLVHAQFDSFTKDYYVVHFGARAGVVPVRDGRILLIAQYRYLIDDVSWEIPGGRIDAGESAEVAAQRECLEETGVYCHDLRPLVTFRPGLDNVENLNMAFYSECVEERQPFTPDPAEGLAIAWMSIEDCVAMVLEQKILDCLTVSAVLAYRCRQAQS